MSSTVTSGLWYLPMPRVDPPHSMAPYGYQSEHTDAGCERVVRFAKVHVVRVPFHR